MLECHPGGATRRLHVNLTESTIALLIKSLHVFIGMLRFENSSKSYTVALHLACSSALQLPGIPLFPGIHMIWMPYCSAILLRYQRRLYIVLVFIMLEFRALIARRLLESINTSRLETFPSPIILAIVFSCSFIDWTISSDFKKIPLLVGYVHFKPSM